MNKKMLSGLVWVITGAVIFKAIKHLNRSMEVKFSKDVGNKTGYKNIPTEHTSKINDENLDEIRMNSATSIQDRHEVAAQVMKEAVEKMNKNTQLHNKHDEDFNNMLDDLDILNEEK